MTTRSPARTIMSTWRARWRGLLLWLDRHSATADELFARTAFRVDSPSYSGWTWNLKYSEPLRGNIRCPRCNHNIEFSVSKRAAVGLGAGDKL